MNICYMNITYRDRELMKFKQRSYQILTRIERRGHIVTSLFITPPSKRINPYVTYGLGAMKSLIKAVGTKADVVLADMAEPGLTSYISAKLMDKPFVFDYMDHYSELARYEGGWLRPRYVKRLEELLPRMAFRLIVLSEVFKERCIRQGIPEDRITMIPNGVDTQMFNPSLKGEEVRTSFNIGEDPLIVFVGKMEPYYRLDILIEAASLVLEEEPTSKFLFVGTGRSEPGLRSLAKKLGIADSVTFAGFQPHKSVPNFIGAADVAVFTHPEGIALHEYMACGKPIVKPRLSVGDGLEHLNSGYLVDDLDPKEFAEGILTLLFDEALAKRMGSNARALAAKYEWESIADTYLMVLYKACKEWRSR